MMTHQASDLTLDIMTACSKLKCQQIKQTQTNMCVWTHLQYFTENGYLSLQNLITVPAGGGSRLLWHINPLNPELNPICYLLALLAHHFLHVSRISVKSLTIRLKLNSVALVRERTILTERPPPVGEVSANFCG